jgi:hypothetical protein
LECSSNTFRPGTNPELDNLFNKLRQERFEDKSHRLWNNYGPEIIEEATALTIVFNQNGEPEICGSIVQRNCWPDKTYRIYNRTWKCANKQTYLKTMSPAMAELGKSQISWLKENVDCELYFISRETPNWQNWMINTFDKDHNMEFKKNDHFYLTCSCECDDSCWQRIIYNGNESLLESWKHR